MIFIEPIALYMTKDLHLAGDNGWLGQYPEPKETIPLGEPGVYGDSTELAILTYGNGYYLSRQAAQILEDKHNIAVRIIDIRWLAPLHPEKILPALQQCQRGLIVDECRKTGSLSAELVTLLVENLAPLPKIKRLTGHDSFIPLGPSSQYVLPSTDDIIKGAIELMSTNKHLPQTVKGV